MNLAETLMQIGHSGAVEGIYRLHLKTDRGTLREYFDDNSTSNKFNVSFSVGIHPLGTAEVNYISDDHDNVFCEIFLSNKKNITITLKIKETVGDERVCRFYAAL